MGLEPVRAEAKRTSVAARAVRLGPRWRAVKRIRMLAAIGDVDAAARWPSIIFGQIFALRGALEFVCCEYRLGRGFFRRNMTSESIFGKPLMNAYSQTASTVSRHHRGLHEATRREE